MFTQSNQPNGSLHKPGLESLLRAIGLDVVYERSEADFLYHRGHGGREIEVLDMVGGYGALLLGHRHPRIVKAITNFLDSASPNHVQGSIRGGAKQLADALNSRLFGYSGNEFITWLANSGTEAVEAALKHAMLETRASTFISLEGAFHGKTLGSLQVTANPRFRQPFNNQHGNVVRVPANDLRTLESTFQHVENLAGLIYEPIQGEAGIRPLSAEFVQLAARLCRSRNVPLIADECQTGLGRTGAFLASHSLGVDPDYVILSKSLGGGLAKISALLIQSSRYRVEFEQLHSSTFADDELSCQVAQTVLELIDEDAIGRCGSLGSYLIDQLRTLQTRYPDVIAEVRGAGLMVGVELKRPDRRAGFLLNHAADRYLLGALVSSFLLNEHQVRVASTLSDSRTIRLQPSLLIQQQSIDTFVDAFEDVCVKLANQDVAALTRPLATPYRASTLNADLGTFPSDKSTHPQIYYYRSRDRIDESTATRCFASPARHVAWVFHLIDPNDLVHLDSSLASLASDERSRFCQRWSTLCEPVVMDRIDIQSTTDDVVRLHPILLPVTSQWMLKRLRGKDSGGACRLVQKAVDVASALGCDVVSLGQFTSIVTRRGKSLHSHGMQVTAGSNYSAALVDQAVRTTLTQRAMDPAGLTLGIVGAAGDIGSTCAAMMAPLFNRTILVGSGRTGSLNRLQRVAHGIPTADIATRLQAIEQADVVICATNSTLAPVGPDCLSSRAIVCDASVPATLRTRISDSLPGVTVVPGAIASLPNQENLDIPGFPLPRGLTYGCMAEGLLLGLDNDERPSWSGRASTKRAKEISQLADRHGFRVAQSASLSFASEPVG